MNVLLQPGRVSRVKSNNMISVTEARQLVATHVRAMEPRLVPLGDAAGCVLASDVVAPYDLPLFPQAAMDGYAFNFSTWQKGQLLPVTHVVAAGDDADFEVPAGGAVRIFTGAPVPMGTDTVVMQEKTRLQDGQLLLEDDALEPGTNVRAVGAEISKGTSALTKGAVLTPAALGFLAMLGLHQVWVYPKPKVVLLITGKELQEPGTLPERGKVYEANSYALIAALEQVGIRNCTVARVADTLEATISAIQDALANADLVLLTGGISVGDYDFVLPAVEACGVQQVFHKVKQRPGKPLYFGTAGNKLVFGLPGNPSSVLSCFYLYVLLALGIMMQREALQKKLRLPLSAPVEKKPGLTHFLKGYAGRESVQILKAQESFRLSSFATANCLIELPEEASAFASGDKVDVWLL